MTTPGFVAKLAHDSTSKSQKDKVMKRIFLAALATCVAVATQASVVLYEQNFESPNLDAFAASSGSTGKTTGSSDGSQSDVNAIYANQPAGFTFAQAWTVETLRVGGTDAWGQKGFQDPAGKAGSYVIGMLTNTDNQDDWLGLTFDIGDHQYLNFQLDISPINLNFWGGPFVPEEGSTAPAFRLSLYNNPGNANPFTRSSSIGYRMTQGLSLLSSDVITGAPSFNYWVFNWTQHIVSLDATGNTNGNVTLVIDEIQGGYAALDNFRIVASDTRFDVMPAVSAVPNPSSWALMATGLAVLGLIRFRHGANRPG